VRHTRHGWWLEEAGAVVPTRPFEGDASADVVVVGGGYLGLWTAWRLLELEPELDVLLLEAAICGHGPSGRNGGFCETLWGDAPTLRERVGDAAALAVCRASEDAVRGIGAWCEENGLDAWYRSAPLLRVATAESQLGSWDDSVGAAAALGEPDEITALSPEEVRRRCDSPLFLGGALQRLNATVQPARLALGLRAKLLERGMRIHERTEVTRLCEDGGVETRFGRVRARENVLAVNSRTAGFPGYRLALAVASSHIVLTEPVPDVLDELGWTGGEAIVDGRTLVHYTRTTDDGRIAFGWGGGAMGFGGRASARLELDRAVVGAARRVRDKLLRLAAFRLEIAHADLELRDGAVRVRGAPDRSVTFRELARTAYADVLGLPPGEEPGLEARHAHQNPLARPIDADRRVPSQLVFANAAHCCLVEIDPATGGVRILKYVVVHDCGRELNPLIVEGMVHGMESGGTAFNEYFVPSRHLMYSAQVITQEMYPSIITAIRELAGGGVIMVPLLVLWAGYRQREAHAMSLGAIIPISVAGILTFGIAGEVRWLDAAALALGAVVGARLGAGLLARVEERPLKIAFGCFLVAAAIAMAVHV